jgi:hypothetical protein
MSASDAKDGIAKDVGQTKQSAAFSMALSQKKLKLYRNSIQARFDDPKLTLEKLNTLENWAGTASLRIPKFNGIDVTYYKVNGNWEPKVVYFTTSGGVNREIHDKWLKAIRAHPNYWCEKGYQKVVTLDFYFHIQPQYLQEVLDNTKEELADAIEEEINNNNMLESLVNPMKQLQREDPEGVKKMLDCFV